MAKHLFNYLLFVVLFFAVVSPTVFASISVKTTTNTETQQQSWLLTTSDGLELKIAQITPDQSHGFFLARGFSSKIANSIATHCPMQIVLKNTGTKKKGVVINVLLKEWQVKNEEGIKKMKLKEEGHKEWQNEEVSSAAKIAFRWATFPSEQTFRPSGDYNWGITTIGLLPTSTRSFDLNIVWHQDGVQKNQWIEAINCAKNN